MINVEIRAPDIKKIPKEIKKFDNNMPTMLMRSINRAATTVKTAIGKTASGVPSLYRIKSTEVNSATKITKLASKSELVAIVTVKGRPRPLVKFAVSPKRLAKRKGKSGNPSSYKSAVLKGHGLIALKNSANKPFVAVTKKGEIGVFSRGESKIQKRINIVRRSRTGVKVYKYKNKKNGEAYTVEALQMHFGPSIPQMVANKTIITTVNKSAENTVQNRLNHEISRYSRRWET
jgi:hypothetical protein